MSRRFRAPVLGGTLLILACINSPSAGRQAPGEWLDIDAVVSFEDEAGIRLYDARAYVAESIGGMATIVEVKQPDAAGFVRVSGHYCAPIIIGTDGGWQQVRSVNLRDSYRIVVRGDRQPSAEKLIGPILPAEQIAELRLEYPNC